MSKKYVKFGPYKLYRATCYVDSIYLSPWDDERSMVTATYWVGPGPDGERIELTRTREHKHDICNWRLCILPLTVDGIEGDITLCWTGAGLCKSPKFAAEQAWAFVEGIAGVYVGVEEWVDE